MLGECKFGFYGQPCDNKCNCYLDGSVENSNCDKDTGKCNMTHAYSTYIFLNLSEELSNMQYYLH